MDDDQPDLSFLDLLDSYDESLAEFGEPILHANGMNMTPHEENDLPIQSNDTLESLVQYSLCADYQGNMSQEMSPRLTYGDATGSDHLPFHDRNKSTPEKSPDFSQGQNDSCNSIQQKEHVCCNVVSQKKDKKRIKWSEDLHEKFVNSIDQLGGLSKAKPKGIHKLMNYEGLSIFQVKSHLQKYRLCQHMPEESNDPRLGTNNTGVQIVDALKMQLDVQRHLYEQLECQKKLQIQIEEQAKELKDMIQTSRKRKGNDSGSSFETNDTCSDNTSRKQLSS